MPDDPTQPKNKPKRQRAKPAARKKADSKTAVSGKADAEAKKKAPAKLRVTGSLKGLLDGVQRRTRLEPL